VVFLLANTNEESMANTTHKQERRGSSTARGYNYKWQQARVGFLKKHPLCKMHEDIGRVVAATVVDHIIPHRGDMSLFWDRNNWQPLCKTCHDGAKQRQEASGVIVGCSTTGIPLDPNHHWSKGGAASNL
jgi:5-methylcytosine-specific restriction endonuclease McrA